MMNTCIKCNKKNAKSNFSKEVSLSEEIGIDYQPNTVSNGRWNLQRKLTISGYICDSCLKPDIKTDRRSDFCIGLFPLMLFCNLLWVLIYGRTDTVLEVALILLLSGLVSIYGFYNFFKLSNEEREKRTGRRIILDQKSKIEEYRHEKRLCEICGGEGNLRISIHKSNPSGQGFTIFQNAFGPKKIIYRCHSHEPNYEDNPHLYLKGFETSTEVIKK